MLVICPVLVASAVGVDFGFFAPFRIEYDAYGVSFSEELTTEESRQLHGILFGKSRAFPLGYTSGCGFDWNVTVSIGGIRYAVACDGCGTVQELPTLCYMHLSDEVIALIHAMFERRGAEVPYA